ncbi:MAG: hypothetical protein QG657_4805 [Acidobacteriota bacterium]|nr:hypothetical protein [Acidobacteriota bacterium]
MKNRAFGSLFSGSRVGAWAENRDRRENSLYSPVKTTADEFYKDIPEYDMLKRGMTEEERIQNGYWVAYQIAEILLKQPTNDTNEHELKKHSSTYPQE